MKGLSNILLITSEKIGIGGLISTKKEIWYLFRCYLPYEKHTRLKLSKHAEGLYKVSRCLAMGLSGLRRLRPYYPRQSTRFWKA